MFEWMPILKGKYFTAEQYLILIILLPSLLFGITFHLLKKKQITRLFVNLSLLSFSWFGNNKYIIIVLIAYNYYSFKTQIFILIFYLLTYDICFAMHNIDQGFFLTFDGASFSSAFTRYFQQINKYHVYATLTEYDHQFILNFQIPKRGNYSVFCNEVAQIVKGSPLYDRYIYHSLINVKQQNNTIRILEGNKIIDEFFYVDFNLNNVTIIDGGDSGFTETSKKVWKIIELEEQIDVINIGGDVAYDNGFINCIYCWDKFLSLYESVCQKQNKLIPLVLSIGNHDVGRVTNPSLLYDDQHNQKIPYIIQMFPQHLIDQEIPWIHQRRSYFRHSVGPVNLITLDSGYLTNSKEQRLFLSDSISQSKPNLVSYHVPVIPLQKEDEEFLINLGEYLNNVTLVFEHHKHNFKRTKRIQVIYDNDKMKVYPGNTYYVGNGAMGIQSSKQVKHHMVAKSNRKAHFWIYTWNNGKQAAKAMDEFGNLVDYFEIS